ncbi:MAG TPA: hypothetical protein VK015_06155 [Microbacterium sp.]|nr:hypothetical protein [Microbacterium sp.]
MQGETYAFDAAPLKAPVSRAEVRAFRASLADRFPNSHLGSPKTLKVVGVFLLGFGGMFLFSTISMFQVSAFEGGLVVMAVFFGLIALALIAAGLVSVFGTPGATQYRLDRFATANGMSFHPGFESPALPGMIFGLGRKRRSAMLVRGDRPRFVEFGNYQYTTGSGKNSSTHTWGYIAVRLDAPLPHIVLDAEGNNSLLGSNLPVRFDRDQRLSLEGDFDRHFSLYCPKGYEADALYLFTPDIMERFIGKAAELDVEIIDDWMFLYSRRSVSTLDADRWAWLFSVVGAMLEKLAHWGRWRDERLAVEGSAPAASVPVAPDHEEAPALRAPASLRPPKGVAREGARLKRRGAGWVVGVIGVLILAQIVMRLF